MLPNVVNAGELTKPCILCKRGALGALAGAFGLHTASHFWLLSATANMSCGYRGMCSRGGNSSRGRIAGERNGLVDGTACNDLKAHGNTKEGGNVNARNVIASDASAPWKWRCQQAR